VSESSTAEPIKRKPGRPRKAKVDELLSNVADKIEYSSTDPEVTPQHKHAVRIVEQDKKRKQQGKEITRRWVEVVNDKTDKRGGKVCSVKVTKTGNKYRTFIGRYTQCREYIQKALKSNIDVDGLTREQLKTLKRA